MGREPEPRHDDRRERGVGYIDGIAEWHRFCARLAAGDDETMAFRALDEAEREARGRATR